MESLTQPQEYLREKDTGFLSNFDTLIRKLMIIILPILRIEGPNNMTVVMFGINVSQIPVEDLILVHMQWGKAIGDMHKGKGK